MKTFRQLFSEVAQPRGEDEKHFKDKHIVTKKAHPVAPDNVFSGGTKKAPKRLADYDVGEDETVYEASVFDVPTAAGGEYDDEESHKKYKRGNKSVPLRKESKMDPVGQEDDDINNDGKVDAADKYLHRRRRAISKAIKKAAVEDLDEAIRYSRSEALKRDKEHGFYADTDDDGYHHVFGASTGYSYGQHNNRSSAEKHARDLNKTHSPHIKESVRDLDEVSKSLAARYLDKARSQRGTGKDREKSIALAYRKTTPGKRADSGYDPEPKVYTKESYSDDDAARKAAAILSRRKIELDAQKARHGINRRPGESLAAFVTRAQKHKAKMQKEEANLDEISRDLARSYIRKASDQFHGEKNRDRLGDKAKKRSAGITLAGKKAYGIGGEPRVRATEEFELDEARSGAYHMTVPLKNGKIHPDHVSDVEKLKAKIKREDEKEGTKRRVTLQGRMGKDNPNADKYKRGGSEFRRGAHAHQRIKLGDAQHADVYVHHVNEEFELDEASQKHLDKAMSIINARITKPGQPPRHPSYHDAPEDIKAAAKNLAKNLSKTQREEAEQIDELSRDTLTSYASKANVSRSKAQANMRNTTGGRDFAIHKKRFDKRDAGTKLAGSKIRKKLEYNEEVEQIDEVTRSAIKRPVTYTDNTGRTRTRYTTTRPVQRDQYGQEKIQTSESYVNEAFKTGSIRLSDGSSVSLKAEDAKLLNQMFKDLNERNRKTMRETLMADKNGFNEILSFAREAL